MSGMRCHGCGRIVSDGATFCRHCGSRIEYSGSDRANTNRTSVAKSDIHNRNKIILIVGGCIIGVLLVVLILVIINTMSKNSASSSVEDNNTSESTSNTNSNSTYNSNTVNNTANSTLSGSSSDYILMDSDKRVVSRDELSKLTQEQVRMACNELYARHGRKFQDEGIQAYFNSKSWYRGTIEPDDFNEMVFNEYEKKNKDIIVMYETEMHYR